MIKLGVIADSHNEEYPVESFAAIAKRERYDAVIHLGDGRGDARWLEKQLPMPVHFVGGNCDLFRDLDSELVLTFGSVRILCVHGHLERVKSNLQLLRERAEALGVQVALFGHTHNQCVENTGKVLLLNPGALRSSQFMELTINGTEISQEMFDLWDKREIDLDSEDE